MLLFFFFSFVEREKKWIWILDAMLFIERLFIVDKFIITFPLKNTSLKSQYMYVYRCFFSLYVFFRQPLHDIMQVICLLIRKNTSWFFTLWLMICLSHIAANIHYSKSHNLKNTYLCSCTKIIHLSQNSIWLLFS